MATIPGTGGNDTQNDTVGTSDSYNMLAGNDTVYAGGGNDTLDGGTGNDGLFGGLGDDYLYAGAAGDPDSDSLDGGGGNDTVDFGSYDEAITLTLGNGGNATINPPTGGNDTDTLTGIENIVGTNFADSITGDTVGNILYGGALAGNDSLFGGTGLDTLYGGGGSDRLEGGNDSDTLYGGDGTDALFGGDANDILIGGALADTIDGDAGTDTASYVGSAAVNITIGGGAGAGGDAAGDTLIQIENLTGSSNNDTLGGDGGDNILDGGLGSDQLFGAGGADYLYAGAFGDPDADSLDGGTGSDTVDFSLGNAAITLTLVAGNATVDPAGLNNTDTLVGIENIVGTNFADSITGDTVANILYGGNLGDSLFGGLGADTLYGGNDGDSLVGGDDADFLFGDDGNDTLDGGTGSDRLYGGLGDDYIYAGPATDPDADSIDGGGGNDTADFSGYNEAITLTLTAGNATIFPSGANDTDTLTGIENIVGTGFADSITGDTVANILSGGALNDSLFGGDGNDTLIGGTGADVLDGDGGSDTASYATSALGVAVTIGGGVTGGDAQGDTLIQIENLIGSNQADTLFGDVGNNQLFGGAGNDLLRGGNGDDTLTGGGDIDTASYDNTLNAVNINLATSIGSGDGTDSLVGIENLIGSAGNDTLTGDDGANQLSGGGGADQISAAGGADLVYGGGGSDNITSGDGVDTVFGDVGNDTIDAGNGSDLVYGGPETATSANVTPLDFNWSAFTDQSAINTNPNPSLADISQDTGGVIVSVNVTLPASAGFQEAITEANDLIYTAPGDPFNNLSSARIERFGPTDPPAEVDIDFDPVSGSGFAADVQNVQFRISDIDQGTWRDTITILAFDSNGNAVPVTFGSIASPVPSDLTVSGNTVTANAGAGNTDEANPDGSVLIQIAGPVARIEINYNNLGINQQHIHISDIHFNAVPEALIDNDSLSGGVGNDTMFGGLGDDTLLGLADNDVLYGGTGNDSIDGGTGRDTIRGGEGADILRGGAGNDTFVIELDEVLGTGNDIVDGGGNTALLEPVSTDNDTIDFSAYGWDRIDIQYTSGDPLNLVGTITIYDAAGRFAPVPVIIGVIQFNEIERLICFTPGTLILTDRGEVAVEALVPGDRVMTRDHGFQDLRWVGRRDLSALDLLAQPELQPVRIAKGAFGAAGPDRSMLVSPQHRVLIEAARAELLFGEAEVLVPAKHLVGQIEAVRVLPEGGVSYIHILFDAHEIVQSDGIWTESFQPAERTLSALDAEARAEVLALFPELAVDADGYEGARLSLKAHEARVLFAR